MGTSGRSIGVWAGNDTAYTGLFAYASQYAGYFDGNVFVLGNLTATGAKSAAVRHPDGSHRRLYALESPEIWFEDFGLAQLTQGRTTVELDPNFACLIDAENYQVFLTPYGDCGGLYVSERSPTAFVVRELQNGKGDLEFGYRVVGRRGDISISRLESVELPESPAKLMPPPELPQEPRPFEPIDPSQIRRPGSDAASGSTTSTGAR